MDMKHWKVKCSRAFTLIELLVVIAIIALLLAIIMPSLNKVKDKAKDIMCRTNLKSMQLATILYTDTYDGKMPEYSFESGLWINKLTVFLDEVDDARCCPRTERRKQLPLLYTWGSARLTWVWYWAGMKDPEEGNYTINWWFYSNYAPDDNRYYTSSSDAKSPSNTPVFADSIWVDAGPLHTDVVPEDFDLEGDANYGGSMSRLLTYRHEDDTNVGFLDGSQRPVELSALWSLKWHKEFETVPEKFREDGSPIYQLSQ